MKILSKLLTRPLVIFDVEATGTNPQNEAVFQFGGLKVFPVEGTQPERCLVNIKPWKEIPTDVLELCHVTNEEYEACEPFAYHAKKIHGFLDGCDIGGYNVRKFDIQILESEFARNGMEFPLTGDTKIFCAQTIFMQREKRDLEAAIKKYCGRERTGGHNALVDATDTLDVLMAQLNHYDDIVDLKSLEDAGKYGETVDIAGLLSKNEAGEVIYNFGKNKGAKFSENPGLAEWMLDKDFPVSTKRILEKLLHEHYQQRKSTWA